MLYACREQLNLKLKICQYRNCRYMSIILLLSNDIEKNPGPNCCSNPRHPNFCKFLRVICKIFWGQKLLPGKNDDDSVSTMKLCDGFNDFQNLFAQHGEAHLLELPEKKTILD